MSDENMLFATEEEQAAELDKKELTEVATQKYLTTNYPITKIPMVPDYVRGIINLRGQTIPLIDMRLRLSLMPVDTDCIIVLNVNEMQIGILVDTVNQIIDIPVETILPMPAHNAQKYVSGMCAMPDGSGTMLVLDCSLLLQS